MMYYYAVKLLSFIFFYAYFDTHFCRSTLAENILLGSQEGVDGGLNDMGHYVNVCTKQLKVFCSYCFKLVQCEKNFVFYELTVQYSSLRVYFYQAY